MFYLWFVRAKEWWAVFNTLKLVIPGLHMATQARRTGVNSVNIDSLNFKLNCHPSLLNPQKKQVQQLSIPCFSLDVSSELLRSFRMRQSFILSFTLYIHSSFFWLSESLTGTFTKVNLMCDGVRVYVSLQWHVATWGRESLTLSVFPRRQSQLLDLKWTETRKEQNSFYDSEILLN